jgi:hypothetical protein
MTAPSATSPRTVTCARCGAAFECCLSGGCWCDAEPYRLPMPTEAAQDCLCPACLRKAAEELAAASQSAATAK